jgi:hypothetical protein
MKRTVVTISALSMLAALALAGCTNYDMRYHALRAPPNVVPPSGTSSGESRTAPGRDSGASTSPGAQERGATGPSGPMR